MKSVFFGKPKDISAAYSAQDIELLRSRASLFTGAVFSPSTIEQDAAFLSKADYVFTTSVLPVLSTLEINNAFPNLKAVFFAGGASAEVAKSFLSHGIRVFSDVNETAEDAAEFSAARIVMAAKNFFRVARYTGRGKTDLAGIEALKALPKDRLRIGILGSGEIGMRVVEILSSFGYEISHFAPFLGELPKIPGVHKCTSLEQLFSECNIVANHLEKSSEGEGIIKERMLRSLPEDAVFISRCGCGHFNDAELAGVLTARPDITAFLDAFSSVSQQAMHRLRNLQNVFLTNFNEDDAVSSIGTKVANTFVRVLYNAPVNNEIFMEDLSLGA